MTHYRFAPVVQPEVGYEFTLCSQEECAWPAVFEVWKLPERVHLLAAKPLCGVHFSSYVISLFDDYATRSIEGRKRK